MLTTNQPNRRTRRDAFTLIEVLVVMAIIVILASVATIGIFRYLDNAKENVAESQMNLIVKGYESFLLRTGGSNYPNDPIELVQPSDGGRPYLDGGLSAITSPWGDRYQVNIVETSSGPKPVVTCNSPNGTLQIPKPDKLQ